MGLRQRLASAWHALVSGEPQITQFMTPDVQQALASPEHVSLLSAVAEIVPTLLPDVVKALRGRDPHFKQLTEFDYVGLYQGVREPFQITTLTFDLLRQVSEKCPPVAAVILTRANQVASFAQLPDSKTDSGFKIALREPEAKPSADDKQRMRALEDAILVCGFTPGDASRDEYPEYTNFEQMVRAVVRDTLTLDAICLETIPGRNAKAYPVVRWFPVDAAEIRLTRPETYRSTRQQQGDADRVIRYVQMRDGRLLSEFTAQELYYYRRNPCTNVRREGYGTSELEILIGVVTAILYALDYNRSYFHRGSVPPGILSLIGNYSDEQLLEFRRQWHAMCRGVGNWWNVPVFGTREGQGAVWTPLRATSRDMEYHMWLAFLITITCSVFSIHPEEIGMQAWSPQSRAPLSEPSPVARLQQSQDKGLVPLLKSVQTMMNEAIVWRIEPRFIFKWVNIDEFDEERDVRLRQQRLAAGLSTVNEERAEMDLEPFPKDKFYGDVPLNPISFQLFQMSPEAQEAQARAQEMMGGPQMPQQGQEEEEEQPGADEMHAILGGGKEVAPPAPQQGQKVPGAGVPAGGGLRGKQMPIQRSLAAPKRKPYKDPDYRIFEVIVDDEEEN